MRPFDTLIELSENQLDEKRKHLAGLEETLAAAVEHRAALDEELAHEQQVTSQDTAVGFAYGAYANHLIQRREQADAAVAEAEKAVEEAREVVREAFAELRRYEMAHEARLEKLRKEQEAKAQMELDEIAGNLLRRRDERM
jgi:flagellar export protein FliJ